MRQVTRKSNEEMIYDGIDEGDGYAANPTGFMGGCVVVWCVIWHRQEHSRISVHEQRQPHLFTVADCDTHDAIEGQRDSPLCSNSVKLI